MKAAFDYGADIVGFDIRVTKVKNWRRDMITHMIMVKLSLLELKE